MLRLWLVIVLVLAVPFSGAGCRRRSGRPVPGVAYDTATTSPKLSTFVFKEEGKLYLMTVGVNATRFHDKDAFIPLTVIVANRSGTALNLHRESFTLVDPISGARYGLAGVNEVRRQGKQSYDRKLMDQEHLASKVDIYQLVPSNFFPYQGLVNDSVELHQFQFLFDNLYFPRPEGSLLGKTFELHINAKGLQEQLFVVFSIPEA